MALASFDYHINTLPPQIGAVSSGAKFLSRILNAPGQEERGEQD
jgi:hypothetical protein